ncbi:SMP-30/gluconolactonase/LRE family protein [Nocardioides donggukensis]|uniref:SMP-30/gluconolactonase/LRE family protein n=1 Tax=Nocardioides donggukensis TaxID=2774019 RepID=A0A927K3W6_9ACTN|nr:SMP-30/gluconolactonase/LRE family protein [Nocardioides donggukensis]MBD8869602.1 SMP-30/gluconolactonase/LRE family protein [Nocardioides donggukensis]
MSLTVFPVPGDGAEDVLVAELGEYAGFAYTGTDDGSLLRVSPDGRQIQRIGHTGGRPLGLEWLPDGRMLVCDARRGLLAVHPDTGDLEPLVTEVDGRPMRFCNNAAVVGDGTIYFSDSSATYGIDEWKRDFVEDTRTGRLLRRDATGQVSVLLEGLAFANGVALGPGEDYVAVAETAARTVVRLWLTGARAGERDHLAKDLPGYPDNIARGSDGLIWVSLASPTDPVVERIQRGPLPLRRLVTRIPERLQPKPKRTVRVHAYDDAGTLVHDLDVSTPDFHMVTGVREHRGRVWMGSLHEPAVAVLDL